MIKFGPSGNSIGFANAGFKTSEQSADWVKNMGLNAFEYSFGRGVNLSDEKALSIGFAFKNAGVDISVHAPYYINLANPDDEMAEKSFNYLLDSAKKVLLMGGDRVIFHPAIQGKLDRKTAVDLCQKRLNILTEKIYQNGLESVNFCPETMGKLAQIGTIEEITDFCKIDSVYLPCVDFGHINARECGSLNNTIDYTKRLEYMIEHLGYQKMQNFHIHFSHIEYTAKGEVKHLTFEDQKYGPFFSHLATSLINLKLEPTIICESAGTQDIDALSMKNEYFLQLNK